jgi:antitoxin component YwqK of YwqJK toxin-antitoxin module
MILFSCNNGDGYGECKRWYENGQLQSQQFNKDEKNEGEWKRWYENGQLKTSMVL